MTTPTIGKLIAVGNSKGIRLPKTWIKQYHLDRGVTITPNENGLLISSTKTEPRQGRKEQFRNAIEKGNLPEKGEFGFQENVFDKKERAW